VTGVDDPIDARAIALSDGARTYVVVSVVAQGLHENYIEDMRNRALAAQPGITDVVVSANHNESSPDTVGIYGGPVAPALSAGLNSGIDDYYMDFLDQRVADAAAAAYDARRPASLYARQFPLPGNVCVRLSTNFPTTYDDGSPAAIDPKVGVLQARDAAGHPIVTLMSLAAHNQEIGHSGSPRLSSDWPGAFHRTLEAAGGGMGMFLVGDNGSEEDPVTQPPVDRPDKPGCDDASGSHAQADATGQALASTVRSQARGATRLGDGALAFQRSTLYAPIENNAFKAAAAAGLFGTRQTYTAGQATGRTGRDVRTHVGVLDVGPDLQLIANPGEAFPALVLGSPFGIEDVGCPQRANPPVPTWRARARFRLQVGLADDMIGYEIPPWAFSEIPGVFEDPTCTNDPGTGLDSKGHRHKLESEGLGPTASAMVAQELTRLLGSRPDPVADIRPGRFVRADGSLAHSAAGAVAIWLADRGATSLTPGRGIVVALPGYARLGSRLVDRTGHFMDYDGQPQDAPDITTRGMYPGPPGCVKPGARYYVDSYPSLAGGPAGAPAHGSGTDLPAAEPCYTSAAAAAAAAAGARSCPDRVAPSARFRGLRARGSARRRLRLHGIARDRGCGGRVRSVEVAVARRVRGRCRYVRAGGSLGPRRSCRRVRYLRAHGTTNWSRRLGRALPSGTYTAWVRARDRRGNLERPVRRGFRLR
jgi:hypothetical protein